MNYQYENQMYQGKMVDAVRIELDGGTLNESDLTALKAQYPEYTDVLQHTIVLFKPPMNMEAVVSEKEALISALGQTLRVVADALPDELAVQHKAIYPQWADFIGKTLAKDKRVRYQDGLYRVQQEHSPQEHQPPGVHTAALYSRMGARELGRGREGAAQR